MTVRDQRPICDALFALQGQAVPRSLYAANVGLDYRYAGLPEKHLQY